MCLFNIELKDFKFIARLSSGITNSLISYIVEAEKSQKTKRNLDKDQRERERVSMRPSVLWSWIWLKNLKFCQCNSSKAKLENAHLFPDYGSVSITQRAGKGWSRLPGQKQSTLFPLPLFSTGAFPPSWGHWFLIRIGLFLSQGWVNLAGK